MDLTTQQAPRSPYETLGGIVFLPRAIDKMRAHVAGTAGAYNARRGTSEVLFRRLFGVTADEFEQLVREHPTDEGVLAALRERRALAPEAIDAWNALAVNMGPRNEAEWAEHWQRLAVAGGGHRRDIVTRFDRLDLDDGREVPPGGRREPGPTAARAPHPPAGDSPSPSEGPVIRRPSRPRRGDPPTATARADARYTPGRTAAETRRLVAQARLYDRSTRRLFEDAGLTRGMKVLDVGSGAGDVALLAADLVGPGGSVVGVDSNPEVLETARERARAADLDNVTFLAGDFRTVALPGDFDAAVGRLVLLYMADPAGALRTAAGRVRAGGVVAFQEPDLSLPHAWGTAGLLPPFASRLWEWVYRVFAASGAHVAMGTQLAGAFERAGLGAPELSLHAPLGAAPDWAGFPYAQESFRSLLPLLEEFRIATAAEVDVDTLAARWRAEVAGTHVPAILTPFVAAWARVPAPGV